MKLGEHIGKKGGKIRPRSGMNTANDYDGKHISRKRPMTIYSFVSSSLPLLFAALLSADRLPIPSTAFQIQNTVRRNFQERSLRTRTTSSDCSCTSGKRTIRSDSGSENRFSFATSSTYQITKLFMTNDDTEEEVEVDDEGAFKFSTSPWAADNSFARAHHWGQVVLETRRSPASRRPHRVSMRPSSPGAP